MIKDLLIENIPVDKDKLISLLIKLGDIDNWSEGGLNNCIETHRNPLNCNAIKLFYNQIGYEWVTRFNRNEVYELDLIKIDYKDVDSYINNKTEKPKNNFEDYGFTADFEGEILKEFNSCFVGWADVPGYGMEPCKWFKDGSTKYECYRITPVKEWYETDKHWILTKENKVTFDPKRRFKIAWTEEMKNALRGTGWRFATPEEVKHLRLED